MEKLRYLPNGQWQLEKAKNDPKRTKEETEAARGATFMRHYDINHVSTSKHKDGGYLHRHNIHHKGEHVATAVTHSKDIDGEYDISNPVDFKVAPGHEKLKNQHIKAFARRTSTEQSLKKSDINKNAYKIRHVKSSDNYSHYNITHRTEGQVGHGSVDHKTGEANIVLPNARFDHHEDHIKSVMKYTHAARSSKTPLDSQ